MGQRVSHAVEEFNRVFSKRFFKPESGYSTHACCPRLFPACKTTTETFGQLCRHINFCRRCKDYIMRCTGSKEPAILLCHSPRGKLFDLLQGQFTANISLFGGTQS